MRHALSTLDQVALEKLEALAASEATQADLTQTLAFIRRELGARDTKLAPRGELVVATTDALADITDKWQLEDVVDRRGPGEAVGAAAALLARDDISDHERTEVQRKLSRLIVRYPVLLDPRLLFTADLEVRDQVPLAHVLAHSPCASLPMESHGVSMAQLRRFATHPSVRRGLSSSALDVGVKPVRGGIPMAGKSPLQIACDIDASSRLRHATRASFIASLTYLNELSRQAASRSPGIEVEAEPASRRRPASRLLSRDLSAADRDRYFGRVANVFWDMVRTGGQGGLLSGKEFASMMQLPTPFPDRYQTSPLPVPSPIAIARSPDVLLWSDFRERVAAQLDSGLFAQSPNVPLVLGIGGFVPTGCDADEVGRRTQSAIHLLVECGALPDAPAAAAWLAQIAVGPSRLCIASSVPLVTPRAAVVFLSTVYGYGARCAEVADGHANPKIDEYHQRWRELIAAQNREARMRDVINATPSINVTAQAPARRRGPL